MKRVHWLFLALVFVLGVGVGCAAQSAMMSNGVLGGDFYCECGLRYIILVESGEIGVYDYLPGGQKRQPGNMEEPPGIDL